jgi:hypothetical protein
MSDLDRSSYGMRKMGKKKKKQDWDEGGLKRLAGRGEPAPTQPRGQRERRESSAKRESIEHMLAGQKAQSMHAAGAR